MDFSLFSAASKISLLKVWNIRMDITMSGSVLLKKSIVLPGALFETQFEHQPPPVLRPDLKEQQGQCFQPAGRFALDGPPVVGSEHDSEHGERQSHESSRFLAQPRVAGAVAAGYFQICQLYFCATWQGRG